MRNIRLFVEFASVVMPGAVLLLTLASLFAPEDWLINGFAGSALGLVSGIVFSFAIGHLLQGFSQMAVEPLWRRVQLRAAAEDAIHGFAGRESERFLTVEQLQQLGVQFPYKLGIPFPSSSAMDSNVLESTVAHAEAYLYAAKVSERLDDLNADYKLNKGLFTAFLIITLCLAFSLPGWIPITTAISPLPAFAASLFASICFFFRMDYHSRKYAQTLFLQFLATSPATRETSGGGGRGDNGGGGGGGGGAVLPRGMGRPAAHSGQAAQPDDDSV